MSAILATAVSIADTTALGLTVTLAAVAFPFVLVASRVADIATDVAGEVGKVSRPEP